MIILMSDDIWSLVACHVSEILYKVELDLLVCVFPQTVPADINIKFEKVSAAVKGYLTRRLLRTEKVQYIIKTIKVSCVNLKLSTY